LADDSKSDEGIDLRRDRQALQRLTEAAEKAKIELSASTQTQISLPFITATATGPKHIDVNLTRTEFEKITTDLLDRCRKPVQSALKDANLKVTDIQEVIMVGGSTRIPAVHRIVEELSGKSPNMTVNPDEVVALGAAVQAGVLSGDVSDIVLLDVTPLSLGVETLGGLMTKLIPRNTTVPSSKSETFSTAADGQTSVEICVLQGEREFVRDNKTLGNFRLDGIPPAPRGIPQIEVRFDIDANGILSVSATDKGSGKKADIKITGASTLAKEDVEKMLYEAEKYAEDDKKNRETIDLKNQADAMVYQARKQISESAEKLRQEDKERIEKATSTLEEAITNGDAAKIKASMDDLQKQLTEIGSAMYNKQTDSDKSQSTKETPSDNSEVIDADFTSQK
jgi:heat shock protein 1/8